MNDVLAGYLERIQADFPTLPISAARLNSDGLVNDVVVIGDHVFRFAKNDHARALLAYEAQMLDLIGRYVATPIPSIEHRTGDYLSYRYVPGDPLYRHLLLRAGEASQERLAHDLATFLQQLHSIPLDDLPKPPWPTADESRRARYERQFAELGQHLYPLLWADQRAWIEDLFAPVL